MDGLKRITEVITNMAESRKKYAVIAAAAVIVLISFILIMKFRPRKPFADLKQENILSIDISFGGNPDYQIAETDQKRIVEFLQPMTVTGKSYLYKMISSQLSAKTYSEIFILNLNTEKQIRIQPCSPFIMIDGTVYHCADQASLEEMIDIYDSYIDVIRQTAKSSENH